LASNDLVKMVKTKEGNSAAKVQKNTVSFLKCISPEWNIRLTAFEGNLG
jgi:hypothetical protein